MQCGWCKRGSVELVSLRNVQMKSGPFYWISVPGSVSSKNEGLTRWLLLDPFAAGRQRQIPYDLSGDAFSLKRHQVVHHREFAFAAFLSATRTGLGFEGIADVIHEPTRLSNAGPLKRMQFQGQTMRLLAQKDLAIGLELWVMDAVR